MMKEMPQSEAKKGAMRRRSLQHRLCSLVCLIICVLMLTMSHAAEDAPLIPDDTEYAVFAAALFPDEPDVPDDVKSDPAKRAYLEHHRVRLDGIHSSNYRVSRLTITWSQADKGSDEAMTADFNRKNARSFRLDQEKLRALVPKGKNITLVSPPGLNRRTGNEMIGFGVTSLSRPGFNRERTKAVLQISHVADYEMGVGYLVYLEKSPKSGAWVMKGVELNRMY